MLRKLTLLSLLLTLAAAPARADGGGQDPPLDNKVGGAATPIDSLIQLALELFGL